MNQMRAVVVAITMATALLPAGTNAEWRELSNFGSWSVVEDYDEAFGTLGYAARVVSVEPPMEYALTLDCALEPTKYIFGATLSRPDAIIATASEGGWLQVTTRFGDAEPRTSHWKLSADGGSLLFNDDNVGEYDATYKQAVEEAKSGTEPLDKLLKGIQWIDDLNWFTWSLTRGDTTAILIYADGQRQKLVFDVVGARDAVNDLLTRCDKALNGGPDVDARNSAEWRASQIALNMYHSIEGLARGTCLEVEAINVPPGTLLTVNDFSSRRQFTLTKYKERHAVIEGPKQRLEFYFEGPNDEPPSEAGTIRVRHWASSGGCQ